MENQTKKSVWNGGDTFAEHGELDAEDLTDLKDKEDNIYTLPVLYGENISICISHIAIFLSILLFSQNNNFDSNLWLTSLYELQNFGSFFINSNTYKHMNIYGNHIVFHP